MKKTLVILLTLVLCLTLALACGCGEDPTPADTTPTISKVLAENKKGDQIVIEGVIYAKNDTTLFVNDGTGNIQVKVDKSTYVVGDKIKVTGSYGGVHSQGYPFVTKVGISIEKIGTGTPITAEPMTMEALVAMEKGTLANYGKYIKLDAIVDDGGESLSLGNMQILAEGATAKLATWAGKKITVPAVVSGNKSGTWVVAYCGDGSDLAEATVDVANIKDAVFATITTGETYGNVELVTSYEPEPSVKFAWTVKEGAEIATIDGSTVKVGTVETDTPFTLTCTITSGTTSASQDFTWTLKTLGTPTTVSEAITQGTGEIALLKAYVANYAVTSNNPAEGRIGLVFTDGQKFLVYETEDYANAQPGDEVVVMGATVDATEKHHIISGGTFSVLSNGNTIDYSNMVVDYVIYDEASMTAYAKDAAKDQYGLVVAFTGVYSFVGTGSSSCRWQLNYKNATASADARYRFSDYKSASLGNRTFSFSAQGNSFLVPEWWTKCGMDQNGSKAAEPAAGTIYAVCTYAGDTMTGWSFVNPDAMTLSTQAESSFTKAQAELNALFDSIVDPNVTSTLNLATSTEHASNITWVCDSDVINTVTGAIGTVSANTDVVLTATYTCEGVQLSHSIKVTIAVGEIKWTTITEALATTGKSTISKMEAYVAAVAGSPEKAEDYRDGMILTDGTNTVWYKTSNYTYGDEQTKYKAGDKVHLENVVLDNTDNVRILTGGTMEFIEAGTIDYTNLVVYETIDSDAKLAALALQTAHKQGYVIKITGNFSLIGCGSSDLQIRYQIHFKGAEVKASADARYQFPDYVDDAHGNRSFCISWKATEELFGTEMAWAPEGTKSATGSKSIQVTGTLYLVGCKNSGATMSAWTVINPAAFSLDLQPAE